MDGIERTNAVLDIELS